jgi:hypothetical protein
MVLFINFYGAPYNERPILWIPTTVLSGLAEPSVNLRWNSNMEHWHIRKIIQLYKCLLGQRERRRYKAQLSPHGIWIYYQLQW